jgi:peptidoglycan/xylan/chitin deacetylase (PgdA/CDA1 family)
VTPPVTAYAAQVDRRAARGLVAALGRPVDAVSSRGPSLVGLIYHRVGSRTPSPVDLPTTTFQQHLDWLAQNAEVVALPDALDRLTGPMAGGSAPLVALTFDDGTADWVDVALPLLVDRGLPATFYVSTDFVERRRPFPDDGAPVSWRGLAELVATGLATIGSHTHRHRILTGVTAEAARDEVDRSVHLIEDRLGVPCRHFAYPKAVPPSPAAEVVVRRRSPRLRWPATASTGLAPTCTGWAGTPSLGPTVRRGSNAWSLEG